MQVHFELLPSQDPEQFNLLVKLNIGSPEFSPSAIMPLHKNLLFSLAKGFVLDFPNLVTAMTEEGRAIFEKAKADAIAHQEAQKVAAAVQAAVPPAPVETPVETPVNEPATETQAPGEPLPAQG